MNIISYLKQKGRRRVFQVVWRYKIPEIQIALVSAITKKRPLEDKIVIESHNDFDCNGGALYDWLIDNGFNEQVEIVWRLYHPVRSSDLPNNVSCVPVYGPSWKKAWAVCTAKWFTADCTVIDKVREDQLSIYMTHGGFGLKDCHGLIDIPSSVDYVLSASSGLDDWTNWLYNLDPSKTKLAHVGFPSLERLCKRQHSRNYRFEPFEGKRILWMPTFRQGVAYGRDDSAESYPYGVPLVRSKNDLDRLIALLEGYGIQLVIKLHPKQDLSVISGDLPNEIKFITGESIKEDSVDNYDLMLDSDALISDYSGAIYEYMTLNRPIAFVLSDVGDYSLGLIEDAERYMPGSKVYTFEDLARFIDDVAKGLDPHKDERTEFLDWLYDPSSECSCSRVSELLGISGPNIA